MIPAQRQRFNARFSPERYERFRETVAARAGAAIEFRLSETPVFLPADLAAALVDQAGALVEQALSNAAFRRAADEVVPDAFRLRQGEDRPTFVQVDFGLVRTAAGRIEGRLVELQAFPSLYGFQAVLADTAIDEWGLEHVTPYLGGLTAEEYRAVVGRALLGGHDPAEVVLLEIDPAHQKTRPDFTATERRWGVRAVDLRDVRREGRRLFVEDDRGRRTPIARIYNRVIPDELQRRGLDWPFPPSEDLDVEWTGGPDWYFRLSKFALPWLRHPWVPPTRFLDEVLEDDGTRAPIDAAGQVLKPLFSFAGGGIVFSPTAAQLGAIPAAERRHYALQERVPFTPVIDTPHGATQVEIRIMLVRDGDTYRAVLPLGRMGRGLMMGVDHNKGLAWVGAAAVLVETTNTAPGEKTTPGVFLRSS